MAGWSGFTDQELEKLKVESDALKATKPIKKPKASKIDQVSTKKKVDQRKTSRQQSKVLDNSVVKNMVKTEGTSAENDDLKKVEQNLEVKVNQTEDLAVKENESASSQLQQNEEKKKTENIRVLTDKEAAEEQMSSLEKLQLQQQVIESQNKKKQVMIKEALAERMRQTQHESLKLKEITKQLAKLDQVLQADVEMLRDKIDEACTDFSHAQKRFQTAEKEYVTAKLEFYKKKEDKDELQECLYTIIQENELRKSKKLEELMAKLTSDSDSLPSSPISPPLVSPLPITKAGEPNEEVKNSNK